MIRPHLVWIVADDLGTFDVPFTGSGSEVLTPTLSRLAASGLVLDNYYVQPLCTPSRAAFMTGRHPVQLGLQHGVILDAVPDGVPLNETMLPALLRTVGYRTVFLGKCARELQATNFCASTLTKRVRPNRVIAGHLGFVQPRFTPERRGFDEALGYYTGNAEYFNHTSPCWACGNYTAVDLHYANASHFVGLLGATDYYSTELFARAAVSTIRTEASSTTPLFLYVAFEAVHGASSCYVAHGPPNCAHPDDDELQVPLKYEQRQAHILHNAPRRRYAGMVGALDEAVANITSALETTGKMRDSLVLFTTDNGAPFKHLGGAAMSNYPLRGGKAELWEGGVRGACFLSGGALPAAAIGRRSDALLSAVDWFPTLLEFAGVPLPPKLADTLYGVSVMHVLAAPDIGRYQVRGELLHNSDPKNGRAALRRGKYKLLRDEPPSTWGPDPRQLPNSTEIVAQGPDWSSWSKHSANSARFQLFDVESDPEERHDLSREPLHSAEMARLMARLSQLEKQLSVPLRLLEPDPKARPPPIAGYSACTPSPVGPILCNEPIGLWMPWRSDLDNATAEGASDIATPAANEALSIRVGASALAAALLCVVVGAAALYCGSFSRLRRRFTSVLVPTVELVASDETPVTASKPKERHCACMLGALAGVAALGFFLVALHILLPLARAAIALSEPALEYGAAWPAHVSVVMLYEHPGVLWGDDEMAPPPAAPPLPAASPPPIVDRNNIILFLTDDQDQMLGGGFPADAPLDTPTPLPRTRELLGANRGLTAQNFFAHSPICCPSRAQLLTGRYLHNLAVDPSDPPADFRENCMHVDGRRVNNRSFAVALQAAGYATALFGKYLNRWPMRYVPRGFDAFLANGGGHYLGASFLARGLEFHGVRDGKWNARAGEYSTAIVGNVTAAWVRHQLRAAPHQPYFAMMAPKAPHEPFVPAEWYADTWRSDWPAHEPRPAAWNATAAIRGPRHGNLRTQRAMSRAAAAVVTGVFKNRWRTLLSVDDAVAGVLEACGDALERTFVLFTSDHGFQLGEYNLLMDKRHVYDFDTRVPLLVRGPGIRPGSVLRQPATHVDIAPTLLDMAGIGPMDAAASSLAPIDGRSLLRLLVEDVDDPNLARGARQRLLEAGSREAYAAKWRHAVLVEHLFWTTNVKCVSNCTSLRALAASHEYPPSDVWCTDVRALTNCWATPGTDPEWTSGYDPLCNRECYPTEDEANNFAALRHVGSGPLGETGSLYAEFHTGDASHAAIDWHAPPDSVELYHGKDTWQMTNELQAKPSASVAFAAERLASMLKAWVGCKGAACP